MTNKWDYFRRELRWKKKFHDFWESFLRVVLWTPVRGRRGRWSGCPPDWGGWTGWTDSLYGHTSGCVFCCGQRLVVVPTRWQEVLRYVFLTDPTRGRLFVPGTNPLRGPHNSFVDGVYSGNLPLGQYIRVGFRWTTLALKQTYFLCYGTPDPRCPGQTHVMFKFDTLTTSSIKFHAMKTVKGMLHLVPSRTPRNSGYGVLCTWGLCYMLFLLCLV
jgi:hypothetical protein